ncbi:3-deoxy-D-manno-octulosonic acid transferase [Roseibium sp.]|uniref:3-deoxy-D-manno-octulosonic acid transferase n=1 Tax=Roseibium sp. TaxID=1936156 RepID=UPI003A98325E
MAERYPVLVTLYLALSRLAGPILKLVHAYRCSSGKDDPARGSEKFGLSSLARPSEAPVWIHAASVGEAASVLPLIERLCAAGNTVLLTTVTRTSAELASRQLPDGAIHQYAPFDSPLYWLRFLSFWQPKLALTVESEVWPACYVALRERSIPFCIVNGRMSERSFKGWSRLTAAARFIFAIPDLVLAQSSGDADRFKRLGARSVAEPGNLKFDARPENPEPETLAALRGMLHDRPRWLAALTHPGEDEIALEAHLELLKETPDLLLMLVPRHPVRGDEIARLAEGRGLVVARRSRGDEIGPDTQVYLGDTLGEMGLFYSLSGVCFLGGSFTDVGGHNPVEAANFETAIVSGPKVANARTVYRALWDTGGATKVSEAKELPGEVARLLSDDRGHSASIAAASGVVAGGQGALERTLELLSPYLAPSAQADRET